MDSHNFAIRAEKLSKSFAEKSVLKNISLEIRKGEIFGLVGPDGAGKSTALRIIAGIMEPNSGSVQILGKDIFSATESTKSRIAYMSQGFGLYPDLTVEENVRFYAEIFEVEEVGLKERIDELLRFSYMHPFKKRLAGRLSGGMKQKLQLVCALIHDPEVLILDEPTNGVDPVSRRDFWRMLQGLLEKDVSILVSTSYLDEAERCHRIALIHEGSFLEMGDPSEIKSKSDFTLQSFKAENPRKLFSELSKRGGESWFRLVGDLIQVRMFSGKNEARELLNSTALALSDKGIWLGETEIRLEDVFVDLIERNGNWEKFVPVEFWSPDLETNSEFSVRVKDLKKQFGDFVAVEGLNLKVKPGEIFGFLGPNGAGKSTTIRMLCGLLLPTSGVGQVSGLDVLNSSEKIKERIGYMSQKFSLYQDLTVAENIRFYGGIYGLEGEILESRKEWAIQLAKLEGLQDSKVSVLSLGFRQRLALACSLLHKPSIVFLDEPTSGVDPLTRRQFWNLIYELSNAGVTVFVTTHYMEEAEYCEKIAFINKGRLMAVGTPDELKANSMNDQVFNLKMPGDNKILKDLRQEDFIKEAYLFGAGIHIVVAPEENNEEKIKSLLHRMGLEAAFSEISPGMEDVFVFLAGIAEEKQDQEFQQ